MYSPYADREILWFCLMLLSFFTRYCQTSVMCRDLVDACLCTCHKVSLFWSQKLRTFWGSWDLVLFLPQTFSMEISNFYGLVWCLWSCLCSYHKLSVWRSRSPSVCMVSFDAYALVYMFLCTEAFFTRWKSNIDFFLLLAWTLMDMADMADTPQPSSTTSLLLCLRLGATTFSRRLENLPQRVRQTDWYRNSAHAGWERRTCWKRSQALSTLCGGAEWNQLHNPVMCSLHNHLLVATQE